MSPPGKESFGERLWGFSIGAFGVALVLAMVWGFLWMTNNPIAQFVIGGPTGNAPAETYNDERPQLEDEFVEPDSTWAQDGISEIPEPSWAQDDPAGTHVPSSSGDGAAEWRCFWQPTMNEDWHDDILCTNGTTSERPILLDGQYVTRGEMEAAGNAYADALNGR